MIVFLVGDSILNSIFKIKKTILHCVLVSKEFVTFALVTLYIHCVSWHITTKRQLHFKSIYYNNKRDAVQSCHERERTKKVLFLWPTKYFQLAFYQIAFILFRCIYSSHFISYNRKFVRITENASKQPDRLKIPQLLFRGI